MNTNGIVATGLLFLMLAGGPAGAKNASPVSGPRDKATSPDVAAGVASVEAFVTEAGYAVKGDRVKDAPGTPRDSAGKTLEALPRAEAEAAPEPEAESTAAPTPAPDETVAAGEPVTPEAVANPEPIVFPEDPDALHALGLALVDAEGSVADLEAGAEAFARAAALAHPGAMFEYAWALETGRGVAPDVTAAVAWYERAIAAGEPRAMNNLGWLLAHGKGVARDVDRANALYRQGAEAGEPSAMGNLAWMLENGIGQPQDLAAAAEWYGRAAELGDAQAMLNLGNLHLVGDGVEQDPRKALTWFARARGAGRVEALSYMGEVFETTPDLRDPERAAGLYVRALEAGDTWPLSRAARSWDGDTARALQGILAARGLYAGEIDGAIGPGSRAAMMALTKATLPE